MILLSKENYVESGGITDKKTSNTALAHVSDLCETSRKAVFSLK